MVTSTDLLSTINIGNQFRKHKKRFDISGAVSHRKTHGCFNRGLEGTQIEQFRVLDIQDTSPIGEVFKSEEQSVQDLCTEDPESTKDLDSSDSSQFDRTSPDREIMIDGDKPNEEELMDTREGDNDLIERFFHSDRLQTLYDWNRLL